MAQHVAGHINDLPPGTSRIVKIRKTEVGLFNVNGEIYALPNICPHQFGPVCQGRVGGTMISGRESDWHYEWKMEGEVVACPWHGIEFEIATGQSLSSPKLKVRRYPVDIIDGEILITL